VPAIKDLQKGTRFANNNVRTCSKQRFSTPTKITWKQRDAEVKSSVLQKHITCSQRRTADTDAQHALMWVEWRRPGSCHSCEQLQRGRTSWRVREILIQWGALLCYNKTWFDTALIRKNCGPPTAPRSDLPQLLHWHRICSCSLRTLMLHVGGETRKLLNRTKNSFVLFLRTCNSYQ